MNELKPEIVEWIDSAGSSGWAPREDYLTQSKQPLTCWTAGFVFHEDKDQISLALSATDGALNGAITIPKCAIVGRARLAPKRQMNTRKRRHRTVPPRRRR